MIDYLKFRRRADQKSVAAEAPIERRRSTGAGLYRLVIFRNFHTRLACMNIFIPDMNIFNLGKKLT
jgi:hypothetical protein